MNFQDSPPLKEVRPCPTDEWAALGVGVADVLDPNWLFDRFSDLAKQNLVGSDVGHHDANPSPSILTPPDEWKAGAAPDGSPGFGGHCQWISYAEVLPATQNRTGEQNAIKVV
ncbi:hypothetical protein [Nonomuraea sp. NPDC005650]|uniref:hypothetical protein n=1 Tax=Nonomuraea sp. NPDC005650 TaxID=3157045 RepID=UPI0033B43D73